MSRRPRRTHSAAFKAKVALAAVRGDKTLAELAQSMTCTPTRSPTGRTSCSPRRPTYLAVVPRADEPAVDLKVQHTKIGQLALENDILESALIKAGMLSARR